MSGSWNVCQSATSRELQLFDDSHSGPSALMPEQITA